MYRISTFSSTNDNLIIAVGESERQLLGWLAENNMVRLISVSTVCVVDDQNPNGRFTYLITGAYEINEQ